MSPEGCGRKLRPRVVSRNHEISDAEANGGQAQAQRDRSGEDGCPDETHDPVRTTRRCKCIAGELDRPRSSSVSVQFPGLWARWGSCSTYDCIGPKKRRKNELRAR